MKRIVTLMLALAMVAGFAMNAAAADISAKGQFDFAFEWTDNTDFVGGDDDTASEDDFDAYQRFRTQIDIVTDENLSGTVYFEIGDITWGAGAAGDKGTDGIAIETRRAYIDFEVPNTGLDLRVGLQGIATPGAAVGTSLLTDDDYAAVIAHYAFNDMVEVNALWARPYANAGDDAADNSFDEMDMFGAIVGVHLDGIELVPYAVYASVGKNAGLPAGVAAALLAEDTGVTLDESASAWWAGSAATVTMFDPIVVKADVLYGSVQGDAAGADEDALDRAGWMVAGEVSYKMDMLTPALLAFYGTGEDDDATNGSERMPFIDSGFNVSTFAWGDNVYGGSGDIIDDPTGKWGVYFMLKDIQFIEDLTHQFRVGYVKGTNDEDYVAATGRGAAADFLTEDDSLWEVNFDHKYMIYENLALTLELGYMNIDLDDDVWAGNTMDEDAYKASFNLRYTF